MPMRSQQVNVSNNSTAIDSSPTWSPDGKKMAFTDITSAYSLGSRIFVMNADGTGQVNVNNNNGSFASDLAPNWSPDSSMITYTTAGRTGPCWEIFTMNADGSNKTR